MAATLTRMAKSKPAPAPAPDDQPRKKTETLRIFEDLVRMASVISTADKVSVAELLDPILRPFLTARYREVVTRLHEDLQDQES